MLLTVCVTLQLLLTANDNGVPQQFATQTATVVVNVLRNLNTPYFVNSPYAVTIAETTLLGTSIFRLDARDDDVPVSVVVVACDLVAVAVVVAGVLLFLSFVILF